MKLFTKICLIVAVIAAALGLVGVGAGMAMGASPVEFLDIARDESRQVLKPGRSGAVEVIPETAEKPEAEAAPEATENPEIVVSPETASVAGKAAGLTFGDQNTKGLDLELKAGKIQFYLYSGDEIILSAEDLNDVSKYLDIEMDGENLSIEDNRSYYVEGWELDIYLPDRTFRDVDLDLGAAEVFIEELNAEEISVDLGAGTLEADRIVAGQSADLDVGAGVMSIGYLEGPNLELDCGVGTLEILLQGRESDYTYTLDCGAGSIALGQDMYSGLGRETRIDNSARTGVKNYVDIDCGIGEISIAFEEE